MGKGLLYKHEVLSSDSRNPQEAWSRGVKHNPTGSSAPVLRWAAEKETPLKFVGQQACVGISEQQRPRLTHGGKARTNTQVTL